MSGRPSILQLRGVTKQFGGLTAVDHIDLDVVEGEFFTIVGPSGSGKTTLLMMIAGFARPSAGSIRIGETEIVRLPPHKRDVGMVFQSYALFPHLTVAENITFGLKLRKTDVATVRRKLETTAELLGLSALVGRYPRELSGGQRQRVALARALVNKPRVLLLDEPLGALDLKLREQMQGELKSLQRQLGITFVFVTHDQGEALSMADRVAVFDKGRIQQVDAPRDLYDRPQTPFVADFVGSSNVLSADLVETLTGKRQPAAIRPERLRLRPDGRLTAQVTGLSFLGLTTRVTLQAGDTRLTALLPQDAPRPAQGETVQLSWATEDLHLMRDTA